MENLVYVSNSTSILQISAGVNLNYQNILNISQVATVKSAEGHLFLRFDNGSIIMYSTNGRYIRQFIHPSPVSLYQIVGNFLFSVTLLDSMIFQWDIYKEEIMDMFPPPQNNNGQINAITAKDDHLFFSTSKGYIVLWNIESNFKVYKMTSQDKYFVNFNLGCEHYIWLIQIFILVEMIKRFHNGSFHKPLLTKSGIGKSYLFFLF